MKILLSCLVLFVAFTTSAQNVEGYQKIGFADTQYIVSNLPEVRQVEAELKSLGGQYERHLKTKYLEYTSKVDDYEKVAQGIEVNARLEKEAELMQLQESIRKFEREAEASFLKKQEELMRPIYLKVGRSINEVATENKYSVIINSNIAPGQKVLLFVDDKFDITQLVLQKMGVSVNKNRRPHE